MRRRLCMAESFMGEEQPLWIYSHRHGAGGDSLWALADAVYGDGHFWEQIYAQNKERIGAEPNLIRPGIDLELTLNASQADYTAKGDIRRQEEEFLARGKERGVAKAQLKGFYRRLLADDLWNGVVWDGRSRQINDFEIADLDGNGQADMLVMAGEDTVLVPGEIWLYLNDEPAYILKDEDAYYKDFFVFGLGFWDKPAMKDLDNDGSLELFFRGKRRERRIGRQGSLSVPACGKRLGGLP